MLELSYWFQTLQQSICLIWFDYQIHHVFVIMIYRTYHNITEASLKSNSKKNIWPFTVSCHFAKNYVQLCLDLQINILFIKFWHWYESYCSLMLSSLFLFHFLCVEDRRQKKNNLHFKSGNYTQRRIHFYDITIMVVPDSQQSWQDNPGKSKELFISTKLCQDNTT